MYTTLRGNGRTCVSTRPTKYIRELAAKHNLEEFEQSTREQLTDFANSSEKELILDLNDYNKRCIVHTISCDLELRTQTTGNIVRVLKPQFSRSLVLINAQTVQLDKQQSKCVYDLLKEYPIDPSEFEEHLNADLSGSESHRQSNFSHYSEPLIPPKSQTSPDMHKFRQRLPATSYRDQILSAISSNKVTIITGGTGCGKTTQIPQFLLEEHSRCREPIRIICTQPRRLPAIAVAERVARERGEMTGDTVGYHIRLEQKTSENTILTYCTSGVLLRMLSMDSLANGITHIILDEVHEREQNTDYLLIILREALKKREDLKVILMSATMEGNRDIFENYFSRFKPAGRCDIPSRLYSVEKLYLPDVLALTGYMPSSGFAGLWSEGQFNNFPSVDGFNESRQHYDMLPTVRTVPDLQQPHNSSWQQQNSYIPPPTKHYPNHQHQPEELPRCNTVPSNLQYAVQPNYYNQQHNQGFYYDNSYPPQHQYGYENNWNMQSGYYNQQNYHTSQPPYQPINAHHSMSQNFNHSNEYASGYDANSYNRQNRQSINEMLNEWLPNRPAEFDPNYLDILRKSNVNKDMLIKHYLKHGGQQWAESIDSDLALATIEYCMDSKIEGAILVFLPGYDDISNLKEKVQEVHSRYYKPVVYTLHSQMNSQDQQQVFEEPKRGYRKVILSTNIAEASLTIDDVVFVIDCGKVKEKSYEHNSRISQLKVSWIAKSNAEQRAGRAGRCRNGYCFRLYSVKDYQDMLITQIAEMRRSAIHELCLHAKMFAPSGMNVRRFLDHAPEPPSPQAIDKSLEFLEQLGALFTYEKSFELPSNVADSYHQNKAQQSDPKLTTLGRLIANLPLDPQLARLLLFGVAMKVLQPVLTLVAALAHRDPFTLPSGDDKMVCIMARDKFSKLDYSDHLMLLRVLNAYCDIHPSYTSTFCRQNFLSKPAIIMILGIRRQLFMELKRLHIVPSSANSFEDPELNQFSTSWPMIQGVLVAGSYPGIAFIRSGSKLRKIHPINCSSSGSTSASLASLHPSSSLRRQVQNNKRSDFLNECLVNDVEPIIESVVFQELSKIEEGLTLRTVTAVTPMAAFLFSGPNRIQKFIMDDFELAEEDYDDHLFAEHSDPDSESNNAEAPEFDNDDCLPMRYNRDYYVETDLELSFKGNFRQLQMALRLRWKLCSYFLHFLEKPTQQTSRENFDLLKCVSKVLEIDHQNCFFNKVTDTLPKRLPSKPTNSFRTQRPLDASAQPECVEKKRYPSPPIVAPLSVNTEEEQSDSPPADPTPTIQPPIFEELQTKHVNVSTSHLSPKRQTNSQNDVPSKRLLEELERAQKRSEKRFEMSSQQRQDNNYQSSHSNFNRGGPNNDSREYGYNRRQNDDRHQFNQYRYNNRTSFRGRGFDSKQAEQRFDYDQQDQQSSSKLYVPPQARRNQNDYRKDRPENQRREKYQDDINRQMSDFHVSDYNNRPQFDTQRRGDMVRGGRGGPKVYSNNMYNKKRNDY